MKRLFSEAELEWMDRPNPDERALRHDLQNLATLNRFFGGRQAVAAVFRQLRGDRSRVTLIDLAAGFGDQGRNLIREGRQAGCEVSVIAIDNQSKTLRLAREATGAGEKMWFVQADARQLPFRPRAADFVFCSLALHHFSEPQALEVLREMRRVAASGLACVDLVRSQLAAICIGLVTKLCFREPMTRHDAAVSIRRAFTRGELNSLATRANWGPFRQRGFFWFQQAIVTELEAVPGRQTDRLPEPEVQGLEAIALSAKISVK